MTVRLTNSEMKGYQRCKRQWWLGTYRRLARKRAKDFNRPLTIGERLHGALAAYYVPGDYREDPVQTLQEGVNADLIEYPAQKEDIEKEASLVQVMLEGYMEWVAEEGLDADIRVIEPEAELEVPLIPGVTLLSKIDAQVERISDGKRGAIEHKSVGDLVQPVRKLQMDSQLLTEHLVQFLQLLEAGEDPEENRAQFVLYNMLRKVKRTAQAKPPFYAREEVHHSVQELRSHWKHCHGIAVQILRTRAELDGGGDPHEVCPPNVTGDCHWDCPFQEPCLAGMFDDGSDIEGYLADFYEERDPLERYESKGLPAPAGKVTPG